MIAESRSTDDRGRVVVARRADDDADRARLRHEATLLGLARHPGVVEVVHADPSGDELVTVAPSATTLAALAGRSDDTLRALAATCETVADLHALGLVHGAVTPDAILTGPGRPVLDRFGSAGLAGERRADGTVLRPADDVVALAELVGAAWTAAQPHQTRRGRRAASAGELDRLLGDVAAGRTVPARRLARAVATAVGPAEPATDVGAGLAAAPTTVAPPTSGARAPDPGPDPDPFARLRPVEEPEPGHRPPRLVALAAAVVGVATLACGILGLSSGSGSRPRVVTAPTTSGSTSSSTAGSTRVPSHTGPVLVARAGILAVGARRYVVGAPGDQAMATSWGCQASMRVVLLRPATGEVFTYRTWARVGHDVRAVPAGRVPEGSRLSVATDSAGCLTARATAPDGTIRPLRLGPV